jgi:hypothetical protein
MQIATESLTCRVSPDDVTLLKHVEAIARAVDRPIRPVHLQALLQLPRIAGCAGVVSTSILGPSLREIAQELPHREEWLVPDGVDSPHSLRFGPVDAGVASEITHRFHYLRSGRADGRAYGLFARASRPVALCVVSPLDVPHLGSLLVLARRSSKFARVVSRVFVFEGAPRNSISYLLAQVGREEKHNGITDLVTYVNPNMGFSGSSYKASGWRLLGDEPGTAYRYLDGRYITGRKLEDAFGRRDDEGYRQLLGVRFDVSCMPLQPLLVFHTEIR